VLSEDRFRIRRSRYADKDYGPDLVRRGLYESTLAGGVGNIWGIDPALAPGGVFPNREEFRSYALFFGGQGRFLADMVPANHLSQDPATRVLLSPGADSLVAWGEEADELRLDLSGLSGPLPAVAVDTRRAYREIQLGVLPPVVQTLQLPSRSDWVVAIGRFELR